MTRVRDLPFDHSVVVFDGGDHWSWVEATASSPLTLDGIGAFIRYRDAVATRYGYVVSGYAIAKDGGPYTEVSVFAVDGDAPGEPLREHPSNDRRFQALGEAAAAGDRAAAGHLRTSTAPAGPLLWARAAPGQPLTPVAVASSAGLTHVSRRGAGPLPTGTSLLLAAGGTVEELARSRVPLDVPVHAYTHRTRDKVAARVADGRARATAILTIGTLAQFEAAGRPA